MTALLEFYEESERNRQQVSGYQLSDLTFTGSPASVIEKAQHDVDRFPIMIRQAEQLVGFFCLHVHEWPVQFGGNAATDVLLRALSIDERYRGRGISLAAMREVSTFVVRHLPGIDRIILAVNYRNLAAQKLYQKAGFRDTGMHRVGKIGPQHILYKMV